MQHSLLVVDDEQKVLDIICPYLEQEGFRVSSATTGNEAIRKVEEIKPDLVVLDWMLPEKSGLDICRDIRGISGIAVIMLTAKTEEMDRVLGLEMGADDYMTKPFSLRELSARIRSVLRRVSSKKSDEEVLQRGDLLIDVEKVRVWKNEEEVFLTAGEFQILYTLAKRPGVVYSRLQLLQATTGDAYINYERSIDSHVSHLRKKIGDGESGVRYIQTVHGLGYRFREDR
ncbi:DNA-binding response regulator, OmpR family, contains REC and winged-helix (wHTH) domain [Thermoactinomyces sp. DSM 45891]|uniref:response regulator transcription factor n=1 Tax=Thermoactinomyces sp. DSM 45891 TaxID=1761907 RepID=UPI00091E4F4D|nr:response regulator transcription factor [Thermoactinomyces sp. DSM 45891]SFX53949.1 DNA-binding response regulator, OmpR family, contains REC and winged-helix (wHTH) domain [Thermoactinomyces sp. DSM 45891]